MLEKLRAKPDHIKRSIALGLALVIFSIILFIWITSSDARTEGAVVRDKTVSPVSGVTSVFGDFFSGFKEKISRSSVNAGDSTLATTTQNTFDLSGVVVIDPIATSTRVASSSVQRGK
jgi:hypothetical protein